MSETTALEKIDAGALAALMTPEEVEQFNNDFSAGVAAEYLPQLSIRGGKFRLKIGGVEEVLPDRTLNVHFIGARSAVSKSFYKDGYSMNADQKGPDCSSVDGNYPDSNIAAPIAKNCQVCENNAWGSSPNPGSKGKACSDYKQIVVSLVGATEMAFGLRIPPTSFKPFSSYLQRLKMAGVPANAAITQLSLGDEEYPTLAFDYAGLTDRATFDKLKVVAALDMVQQVIHIQPRALNAAPAAPEPVTAAQPVVVEAAEPEPAAAPSNALAELLAKNNTTTRKPRAKKQPEAVVEAAPEPLPTPDPPQPAAPITDINALLAKLNAK